MHGKKSIWKHAENDVNTLARISLTRRQSRNLSNPRTSRIYISRGEEEERERRAKKLRLSIVSFPKDEPKTTAPFPFPSLFYECPQNCNAIKRFRL